MEIRNRSNGNVDRPLTAEGPDVIDFTRLNRERIADSVRELENSRLEHLSRPPDSTKLAQRGDTQAAAQVDRVAVSAAAQFLAAEEDPTVAAKRRAQVETIRAAVTEGTLVTPERVERAARKLLGN